MLRRSRRGARRSFRPWRGQLSIHLRAIRLRDAAARGALERIQRDRSGAPAPVARVLGYIEEHLFDPDLGYKHILRTLRIGDHSLSEPFQIATGTTPFRYITERRIETAKLLLTDTEVESWRIAQLLGFSSSSAFGRTFKRSVGQPPGQYRSETSSGGNLQVAEVAGTASPSHSGLLEPRSTSRLLDRETIDRARYEAVISMLPSRSDDEQRRLILPLGGSVEGLLRSPDEAGSGGGAT